MSEKIFHWTNTFKTLGEADDGGLDIKGSASTNSLDRAGDIIEPGAWTKGGLDNYKNIQSFYSITTMTDLLVVQKN